MVEDRFSGLEGDDLVAELVEAVREVEKVDREAVASMESRLDGIEAAISQILGALDRFA